MNVVSYHFISSTGERLDPLQFAYKPQGGTEDATLTLVNIMASCLQQPKAYVWILFDEFSTAFNTVQTRSRWETCALCSDRFLKTDRPQRIQVNAITSDVIVLKAGVPQGCVSSPLLFSIYTNEMEIHVEDLELFKYAEGLALVGTLSKNRRMLIVSFASRSRSSFMLIKPRS